MNTLYVNGFVAGMNDKEMGNTGARSLAVTLAHKERWQSKNGDWQDQTHFLQISFTGKLRDRAISTGLSVGEMILVTGKISTFQVKDNFPKMAIIAISFDYINIQNKPNKDFLEKTNQELINSGNPAKYYGPRAGNKDERNIRHTGEEDIPF